MTVTTRSVYIASTTDTKGRELTFVNDLVRATGLKTVTVDLSTKAQEHPTTADISAATVAAYHPQGAVAVFCGDRGRAISAMAVAFERFMASREDVAALLGLGGSGGTALITPAMQSLQVGIPTDGLDHGVGGCVGVYRCQRHRHALFGNGCRRAKPDFAQSAGQCRTPNRRRGLFLASRK